MKEIICDSCGKFETVGNLFYDNNVKSVKGFDCIIERCKGKMLGYKRIKQDYSLFS